jgi:hypothetical protein
VYQVSVSRPGDLITSYDVPDSSGYATLVKLKGLTARLTFPAVSVTVPCMYQQPMNAMQQLQMHQGLLLIKQLKYMSMVGVGVAIAVYT